MNLRKIFSAIIVIALFVGGISAGAQQKPIRFALITDTHYSIGSQSVNDLRACIADVNSQKDLDFVIFGGDITDFGADDELAAVKPLMDSLKLKYYVVAGNHDAKWSESGCNTFRNVFGYEHFEFEYGGWRFIGCNCGPDMRMAPALVPKESIVWLQSLKPGIKTVFVNHYPQDSTVLNYFDVTRQLKRIGVEFEIGGHFHENTILNYDGIPGILGRSSLSDGKATGYSIVEINNDHVSVSERRVYGSTPVQYEPWFAKDLAPVADTVHYDAHGLPGSYPWMRYDVNDKYPQVKEVWKISDNSNIVAGFAVSNSLIHGDMAFYTTASGLVRAISLKDGHSLWTKEFAGKIFSTPAVSGKYLVFGCTDGYVYALNKSNGSQIWKRKFDKSVLGSPVIFKGKVFVGASDGTFRALNLQDGSSFWTFNEVKGFIECRAYVDDDQVVFGTWANNLYSLDTKTGHLQWIWKCKRTSRMFSPAACWPVKADGRIYIAVPDRKMYALDARTGEELYHENNVARESIGLSEDGKTVYTKSMYARLIATPSDIPLAAIPSNMGKGDTSNTLPHSLTKWNVGTGAGYDISPTSIVEKNGIVLMPTDKGNLLAYSAEDGSLLWAHKISIGLVNPLNVWVKGKKMFILASTMDGSVSLLSY
jgi:outer membrane protein assembly factor BamB/calcineurin-like phosphoesterase family protein